MKSVQWECLACRFLSRKNLILVAFIGLLMVPAQSVFATSSIANRVMNFCSSQGLTASPDVSSCSACHTTTTNRSVNDLNQAGIWALNGQDSQFCPATSPAPTPTPSPAPSPTPTPSPTPGTGMGMGSGSGSGMGSIGRGMGSSIGDDDDDDEGEDDDDDGVSGSRSGGSGLRSLRSFFRSRFGD